MPGRLSAVLIRVLAVALHGHWIVALLARRSNPWAASLVQVTGDSTRRAMAGRGLWAAGSFGVRAMRGRWTGTSSSAIQGDSKGWPEPAHLRVSVEDRFGVLRSPESP